MESRFQSGDRLFRRPSRLKFPGTGACIAWVEEETRICGGNVRDAFRRFRFPGGEIANRKRKTKNKNREMGYEAPISERWPPFFRWAPVRLSVLVGPLYTINETLISVLLFFRIG